MDTSLAILGIGGLIFLGHIFAAVFDRLGIPDILPLMALGLIIGPVLGLVTPEAFGKVGPVFSTVALVAILFESGLELRFSDLKASLLGAVGLTILSFIVTAAVVTVVSMASLHLTFMPGILLGFIVGGTSAAVVIPILAKLPVSRDLKVGLTLEASISDVLCIIGTLTCLKVAETGSLEPGAVVGNLISSLVLASVLGIAFGLVWSYTLNFFHQLKNAILTTPAFLCILYAITEMLGYSGPIAALSFGIILGNVKQLPLPTVGKLLGLEADGHPNKNKPIAIMLLALGNFLAPKGVEEESTTDTMQYKHLSRATARDLNFFDKAVISELIFIVKTFFFVYLGLSIQLKDQGQIIAGCLLTGWIYLLRIITTRITLGKELWSSADARLAAIMCPKGLAAAVLASMPVAAGLPYGHIIQNVAYAIILSSTVLSTLLLVLMQKGVHLPPYCFVFSRYKTAEETVAVVNDLGS